MFFNKKKKKHLNFFLTFKGNIIIYLALKVPVSLDASEPVTV